MGKITSVSAQTRMVGVAIPVILTPNRGKHISFVAVDTPYAIIVWPLKNNAQRNAPKIRLGSRPG
jgi:hypothetical protein